jgi:hypothetical protein
MRTSGGFAPRVLPKTQWEPGSRMGTGEPMTWEETGVAT